MNKMHSIAKITIGLWTIIVLTILLRYVLMTFTLLIASPSTIGISSLLSIIPTTAVAVALAFILIKKRDAIADKIVGQPDLPMPDKQILWLPTAYRLVAITLGLLFLYKSGSNLIWQLSNYIQIINLPENAQMSGAQYFRVTQFFTHIILLAASIYLLCGAPHFVRWQVRKTMELFENPDASTKKV